MSEAGLLGASGSDAEVERGVDIPVDISEAQEAGGSRSELLRL